MCTVTIRNWLLDIVITTFYPDFYNAWSWFLLSLRWIKRIFKFIDDFMFFIDQSAALTCSAATQCSFPMGKDSRQGPRQKTKVSRAQASSSTQQKDILHGTCAQFCPKGPQRQSKSCTPTNRSSKTSVCHRTLTFFLHRRVQDRVVQPLTSVGSTQQHTNSRNLRWKDFLQQHDEFERDTLNIAFQRK